MMAIKSKRGAEYTTSTIIVIVLALLVLVVLAMGFGAGWSNLWSKITGFFTPVNVDSVKQACQYACTTQSVNAFCCQSRDVRFDKTKEPVAMKCTDPSIKPSDCSLDCPPNACAGPSGASTTGTGTTGSVTNPFASEAEATTYCNNLCAQTNFAALKTQICSTEIYYISGANSLPRQCSVLGDCASKCGK
ncbi:MAG: hypothetical protein NT076_01825 [Candidatus Pacearchaeota archaeon]|nr:hypothetical protein [Candidatus Pacearchaeota archaeon]